MWQSSDQILEKLPPTAPGQWVWIPSAAPAPIAEKPCECPSGGASGLFWCLLIIGLIWFVAGGWEVILQ